MARHGFDRPLDYRRLHWSRWFRCESHHSLLFVPSKPGVFALAEEIMHLTPANPHVATDAACPERSRRVRPASEASGPGGYAFPNRHLQSPEADSREPEAVSRRMLAVTQFFEDDDMAFVLDRMLSRQNPMRARLVSGRYFVRFVVIDDQTQRRTICNALNQWMVSAAERATGIGSDFASSLELTPATEYLPPSNDARSTLFDHAKNGDDPVGPTLQSANADSTTNQAQAADSSIPAMPQATAPQLDSGAATNLHCPPFPSGF
jgi:hypothetical protein